MRRVDRDYPCRLRHNDEAALDTRNAVDLDDLAADRRAHFVGDLDRHRAHMHSLCIFAHFVNTLRSVLLRSVTFG